MWAAAAAASACARASAVRMSSSSSPPAAAAAAAASAAVAVRVPLRRGVGPPLVSSDAASARGDLLAWLRVSADALSTSSMFSASNADLKSDLQRIHAFLSSSVSSASTDASSVATSEAAQSRSAELERFLEQRIDSLDDELPPLTNFILPGGAHAAAVLHVARTACRRFERRLVREAADTLVIKPVNRLSDYLFTAARACAHRAMCTRDRLRQAARRPREASERACFVAERAMDRQAFRSLAHTVADAHAHQRLRPAQLATAHCAVCVVVVAGQRPASLAGHRAAAARPSLTLAPE